MCSEALRVAAIVCVAVPAWARARRADCAGCAGFFPDDPISRDDDTAMDARHQGARASESYDFLINTFATKSDASRSAPST